MKKYAKDWAIVLTALAVGFIAVGGDGLADLAESKFAWTFWAVAQVVCLVAAVGFWVYAWKKQDDEERK